MILTSAALNKSLCLSFCEINIINDFIVEVISQDGVEIGELELKAYHDFYDQLERLVGVPVNRVNAYSYSFAALRNITKNKNMAAVAILISDAFKERESKYVALIAKGALDIQIFFDRQKALSWLNSQSG